MFSRFNTYSTQIHMHTHRHTHTHTHTHTLTEPPKENTQMKTLVYFLFSGPVISVWLTGIHSLRGHRGNKITKSITPKRSYFLLHLHSSYLPLSPCMTQISVCVCMCIVRQAIMVIKATTIKVLFAELYVNVVFVIRCIYSAVSLTLIKELRFIRIIYYYYYYKSLTM